MSTATMNKPIQGKENADATASMNKEGKMVRMGLLLIKSVK